MLGFPTCTKTSSKVSNTNDHVLLFKTTQTHFTSFQLRHNNHSKCLTTPPKVPSLLHNNHMLKNKSQYYKLTPIKFFPSRITLPSPVESMFFIFHLFNSGLHGHVCFALYVSSHLWPFPIFQFKISWKNIWPKSHTQSILYLSFILPILFTNCNLLCSRQGIYINRLGGLIP